MQTHSSSQKGFIKSRGQAVGTAEQELGVLDAQAAQQHGQAVDANAEATVGRAAVLDIPHKTVRYDKRGNNKFVRYCG